MVGQKTSKLAKILGYMVLVRPVTFELQTMIIATALKSVQLSCLLVSPR